MTMGMFQLLHAGCAAMLFDEIVIYPSLVACVAECSTWRGWNNDLDWNDRTTKKQTTL